MGAPLASGQQAGMVILEANPVNPTFAYSAQGVAAVAASYPMAIIEAGPVKNVRIRRVTIWNPGAQTTAGLITYSLVRTTTAGSGTTAVPAAFDSADAAFSGILRIPGQTAGTAGTVLYQFQMYVPSAAAAALPFIIDFANPVLQKPVVVPAGIANGVFLRCDTGGAGSVSLSFTIEFTEE